MTEERTTEQRNRLEINYVQVVASALAAISSAVLLSTVGVAGTVIGAAVGSVFATAGSAIYSYSIRLSRERVARAQAAAFARMQAARVGVFTGPMGRPGAERAEPAEEAGAPPKEPPAWREALRRLPWKWIAVIAVGVFLVAMIVILCFELLVGRSVSQITGGTSDTGHRTSIPGLGSSAPASHAPTPTPSTTSKAKPTPTTSPSQRPTTALPSAGATQSATPTQAATTAPPNARVTPTPTPTPSPSATESSVPSSGATPTGTPSP